jgi:hypothetical protein
LGAVHRSSGQTIRNESLAFIGEQFDRNSIDDIGWMTWWFSVRQLKCDRLINRTLKSFIDLVQIREFQTTNLKFVCFVLDSLDVRLRRNISIVIRIQTWSEIEIRKRLTSLEAARSQEMQDDLSPPSGHNMFTAFITHCRQWNTSKYR